MKIEISLNVAVVCEKPYAVELKDGRYAICIPCVNPETREHYPVYMYLDEVYEQDPSVGSFIAYEWDSFGRREYLSARALSGAERDILRNVQMLFLPYIGVLLNGGAI